MQTWRLMVGDVREQLALLPEASVQCVVTSPPYWGLRDYGVEGQIGMEERHTDYVSALVDVFDQVRRVLRNDGILWLNLGDCYANDGKWGGETVGKQSYLPANDRKRVGREKRVTGLKSKDLVGIPWTVAFALRDAGWWLRRDIVWNKPNPMPESVNDRPSSAHEYIFLLTKSPTYYYDAGAVKEPFAESTLREIDQDYEGLGIKDYKSAGVQNPSDVKRRIIEGARRKNEQSGDRRRVGVNDWDKRKMLREGTSQPTHSIAKQDGRHDKFYDPAGRNCRSVWTITTQPYPDAHFATFPEAIPERCIRAGSRIGDTVMDPFAGSGTTGEVALRLGRSFIGIELNPEYAELARKRIGGAAPLFAEAVS